MVQIKCPKCNRYQFSVTDNGSAYGVECHCSGCKLDFSVNVITTGFLYTSSHLTTSLNRVTVKE